MRSKVLFFPMLKLELIETYHVKLSTVKGRQTLCQKNVHNTQFFLECGMKAQGTPISYHTEHSA